jgi:hypothetical protein
MENSAPPVVGGSLVGILAPVVYVVIATLLGSHLCVLSATSETSVIGERGPVRRKINFVAANDRNRTANPAKWEAYDGAAYTKERGYGWLSDLSKSAWDSGETAKIILPDGRKSSPKDLGRLELANGHASHSGNHPIVFRIDLPDGRYQVKCTSVWPSNIPLPLVDERTVKFRAHDVVFAGSVYGAPVKVEGHRLVEGAAIVDVTEGHLRIVMGDPAYGGWTWSYSGPLWRGWWSWWKQPSVFANNWRQKITRTVDPGFHGLRLNSLEIERVPAPAKRPALVFRDFFNRDDSADINSGVAETDQWVKVRLNPAVLGPVGSELYKTSLKLIGSKNGKGVLGVVQKKMSPETGTIRYSTRVSLFTGEGSQIHSGIQEAGLLMLGEPTGTNDFNSTFIGVAYDRSRTDSPGRVRYRVGDGQSGYRTNSDIPDTVFPFKVSEGEYEIVVEHNVAKNILSRVQINGTDVTSYWTPPDRKQRIPRGLFGMRASMDSDGSGVSLQQFYWFYRVEDVSSRH